MCLSFKGIPYKYHAINLLKGDQQSAEFLKVNPQGLIPALNIDSFIVTESMAIMEYLEETRPEKHVLPKDPKARANVRRVAQMIVADIQPLQNAKILNHPFIGPDRKMEWANHVISSGFAAVEKVLHETAGKFCVGDEISIADFCLIPQVYNARRFKVDLTPFPTISRIASTVEAMDFAVAAHPDKQPDFDPNAK